MASPPVAIVVYNVIKYGLIFGILLSILVLLLGSYLVYDTYYITKNPKFFISETLLMGILTSIPVMYISHLRGAPVGKTLVEFAVFFIKIVFLHITFQLSGVYSVLFPMSSNLE